MKRGHSHNFDYYSYISEMAGWNSTWKVIFSLVAMFLVIGLDLTIVSLWTMLFMCVLTVKVGHIHISDYIRAMAIPILFIVMSGLAITIEVSKVPIDVMDVMNISLKISVDKTYIYMTNQGFFLAIKIGVKALGAVSAMYMLTLSTPMGNILVVLQKLHIPQLIIELMHLIYRYIFIMSDVSKRQKDAAASRLGYRNFRTSIRSFSSGLANLLVVSLKRADACFDAMESRGYQGHIHILEEKSIIPMKQIVWSISYLFVIAGLVIYTYYS